MSQLGLGLRIAAALLIFSSNVHAEPGNDAVTRLRAQANAAQAEGRFAESRELWEAIWKLERSQVAACNIGALAYRIGDAPAAVRWLSLCKEIMRPPSTPEERDLYESRIFDLARARQLVGELRIVLPAGATCTIDGEQVSVERDKTIPVNPGRHAVVATLNGAAVRVDVDVRRGELRDVRLDVTAPALRPTPTRGPALASSPPASGLRTGLILGGAAASTLFLALGGGLMVVAHDAEMSRNETARSVGGNNCLRLIAPECKRAARYENTMFTARELGAASFIAGGVLAAGTLGFALFTHPRAEITASASGMTLSGVW
ncbi:hypothetical protein WMF28_02280 [Sorangium sp. So ce590]|uniref:hypothetical protein n=1 Tax=Sorangium sp. So ce590 TaxID=3133317 RepID=UPI003F6278A9